MEKKELKTEESKKLLTLSEMKERKNEEATALMARIRELEQQQAAAELEKNTVAQEVLRIDGEVRLIKEMLADGQSIQKIVE